MTTETAKVTRRPQSNDPEVLEATARKLIPQIMDWFESAGDISDTERKDAEDDLLEELPKILSYSSHKDGYGLAKDMENHLYFEGDSQLVEIMDEASSIMYDALKKAEKRWVEDNKITPSLNIGDEVSVQQFSYFHGDVVKIMKGKAYEGVITEIKEKTGKYYVRTPENKGNGSYIFNFEECRPRGTEWKDPAEALQPNAG